MCDKELVQRLAEINGMTMVRYYKQGDDPRCKESWLTKAGWCAGMCVWWLTTKHRNSGSPSSGNDFWEWAGTADAGRCFRDVMQKHRELLYAHNLAQFQKDDPELIRDIGPQVSTANATTNLCDKYLNYFRSAGMSGCTALLDSDLGLDGGGWNNIANYLSQSAYKYVLFALTFTDGGSHAVAAYKRDFYYWDYFDPNIGEYTAMPQPLDDFLFYLSHKCGIGMVSDFAVHCAR